MFFEFVPWSIPISILFYPNQFSLLSDFALLDPALLYRSSEDDQVDALSIQFQSPLDFLCSHVHNKIYQKQHMMDNTLTSFYIFSIDSLKLDASYMQRNTIYLKNIAIE